MRVTAGFIDFKKTTIQVTLDAMTDIMVHLGEDGINKELLVYSSAKIETKWYLQVTKSIIYKMLTLYGAGDSLNGWFIKL